MNKRSILRILTAIGAAASAIAGVDLTGLANILPQTVAAYLFLVGPVVLMVKEIVVVIGDYLDDGKRNDSWKI